MGKKFNPQNEIDSLLKEFYQPRPFFSKICFKIKSIWSKSFLEFFLEAYSREDWDYYCYNQMVDSRREYIKNVLQSPPILLGQPFFREVGVRGWLEEKFEGALGGYEKSKCYISSLIGILITSKTAEELKRGEEYLNIILPNEEKVFLSDVEHINYLLQEIYKKSEITPIEFCGCVEEILKNYSLVSALGIAVKFGKYCPQILKEIIKTPEELEKGKEFIKGSLTKFINIVNQDIPTFSCSFTLFKEYLQDAVSGAKDYKEFTQNLENILTESSLCWKEILEKINGYGGYNKVPPYNFIRESYRARKIKREYGDFEVYFKPEESVMFQVEREEEITMDAHGYPLSDFYHPTRQVLKWVYETIPPKIIVCPPLNRK